MAVGRRGGAGKDARCRRHRRDLSAISLPQDGRSRSPGNRCGALRLFADHSPYYFADKIGHSETPDFTTTLSGIPGIETRLPLLFSEGLLTGRLTLERYRDLTSRNAASIYGFADRKGSIAVGLDADLALWDPTARWTLGHKALHSRVDFTPYEGKVVTGRPTTVLVRGVAVVADGKLQAEPGFGRFVARAAADPRQRIVNRRLHLSLSSNKWVAMGNSLGVYGNDYLQRAFIAFAGLGALPPEEAIYPMAPLDSEGRPLTGASRYVLHFAKEQIPPADAFWSLTMYGADQFFVANPIDRFAIGDRDKLAFNADGSLDLYIQKDSPGADKESNWVPAPDGPYSMNLRLYLPRRAATEGRWTPPAVTRVP